LLAAPQRLQRKHNLARLPPQQVFVAAKAVKGEGRLSSQAQETIGNIVF
jgi:hypothetical protein